MNKSLTTYSPRVKPTGYDALAQDVNVQTVTVSDLVGVRVFNVFAFSKIRIERHFESNPSVFSQSEKAAYTTGPATTGAPPPFASRWAAWVATAGIRVGRLLSVTPPDDHKGGASGLYPTTKAQRLTLAFDSSGLIHIGIQKTETSSEVKRYVNEDGDTAVTGFAGMSPMLFNTQAIHSGGEQPHPDGIVCFYLKRSEPLTLFARFAHEGYGTEHVLVNNLQTPMARLIHAEISARRLLLYGKDTDGRDVTLYSKDYAHEIGPRSVTFGIAFTGGAIMKSVRSATLNIEKTKMSVSFTSGKIGESIAEVDALDTGKASLGVSFTSGELQ